MISVFVVASILEMIGLGLVVPFILLLVSPETFEQNPIGLFLSNLLPNTIYSNKIILFGLFISFLFAIKSLIIIMVNKIIITFSMNLQTELKISLINHYLNIPYTEYINRNSSEYIQTILSYTSQFTGTVLQSFFKILSESFAAIAILIVLALHDFISLSVLIMLLIGIGLCYDMFYKKKVTEFGKKSNQYQSKLIKAVQESMNGFKEIRVLSKEKYFKELITENSDGYANYSAKTQLISLYPRYLLEFSVVVFIIAVVLVSVSVHGNVETLATTLGLFGVASLRLMPIANSFLTGLTHIRIGRHATACLYDDLKNIEIKRERFNGGDNEITTKKIFNKLSLNNISYKYPSEDKYALKDVSLDINMGDSIGIIGASGSGKSTLIDTILGFLKPQEGEIIFDGKKLEENIDEWRGNIAYIPQSILILDDTIKNNIALGVPEDQIDINQLNNAIRMAKLSETIAELKDGVDTILGEDGIRFSGGQRQRISLARAFYHNRNVIVMDEATSALDTETEREIVNEIKFLKGKVTTVVIAHRLSTVEHCDKIYKMESGKIIDQGNYQSVIGDLKISNR